MDIRGFLYRKTFNDFGKLFNRWGNFQMRFTVLLALALFFVSGCKKSTAVTREKTTRIRVAKLEKRLFQQRIPLQGTVQPEEFAVISAKISGTLEMLNVDEGDFIRKGTTLFGIDRQVLRNQVVVKSDEIKVREAALESARINLKIAEISLAQALRDFERAQNLSRNDAISRSSVEAAETDYKKAQMAVNTARAEIANAEAQLTQAQSNLKIAEKNLDDSITIAPFDCVVFDRYVEANEFVTAGKNILRLENISKLEVVCFISAVYYDQIIPGKTAVDFTSGGQAIARSKVSYKAPGIDPESRTFKIKIEVPPEAKLVSGMLCELDIILAEREAYGLPESAVLLRANDRRIAFTVDPEKRAKSVDITPGIIDSGFCEILNAGELLKEKFVVSGQTFINNGSLLVEAGTEQ